jgi:hypothetical protein
MPLERAKGSTSDIGPWFYAMFSTNHGCTGCLDDIQQGDRIRYVDGGIVCESCGEEAEYE